MTKYYADVYTHAHTALAESATKPTLTSYPYFPHLLPTLAHTVLHKKLKKEENKAIALQIMGRGGKVVDRHGLH